MAHFGAVCFPGTGHLNPMLALGRALERRGHRVTVFQIKDVEPAIRAAGLGFSQIGAEDYPEGTLRSLDKALGRLKGLGALRFTLRRMRDTARMVLRDAPAALAAAKVDAMLVDQAELAGGSVAEHLKIPFLSVIFFPPVSRDPYIPPFNFGWRYGTGPAARLRNAVGNKLFYAVATPTLKFVNQQRRSWGLPPKAHSDELSSTVAQISQTPEAFDFPRKHRPAHLHHTGPFVDAHARRPVDFPWERLNGKPLVYASMGSLQNGFDEVFRKIAIACAELPVQLVLSLGGGLSPEDLGPVAGEAVVVKFAPQLELLQRAALTITHAGLNTTLESLSQGIPMVAIPVGNDQPGVASRIAWTGTGEVVPFRKVTPARLRAAVEKVLSNPSYREAALRLKEKIREADGLNRAVDVIEKSLGVAKNAG